MPERKVRILLGKLGEGHKDALQSLARNFSEAGLEVIYTELQEPEAIVRAALQEAADHIGITTLPGTDIQAFAEIKRLLVKERSSHITITAGGFLEKDKIALLKDMGVMEFFPRGTLFEDLVQWTKKNIKPTGQ
jgi:methylmalonyl-CoA mutase C-terminal domain/subunit